MQTKDQELSLAEVITSGSYRLVQLIRFGRTMQTSEVLEEFKARALRPATPSQLLVFTAIHGDPEFPMIALDAGDHEAVCVDKKLKLIQRQSIDGEWSHLCRFAAVPQ